LSKRNKFKWMVSMSAMLVESISTKSKSLKTTGGASTLKKSYRKYKS